MVALSKIVISYDIPEDDLSRLRSEFPNIEFSLCLDEQQLPSALTGAQVWVGSQVNPDSFRDCKDLQWVQSRNAGVETLLVGDFCDSDVIVTNFSGVQASNIAEHLLAMMLVFARGLPGLFRNQINGQWTPSPEQGPPQAPVVFYSPYTHELGYQTLGIVGLGDIGCELAKRAKGLGMRVIGSKRRPEDPPEGVDRLYGSDNWREILPEADHVAICLPLTSLTHHLFGEAEFKAMKPTAYIHNTSRGTIIDQDALIQALENGEIAGAGLDVTTPEPLPSESPLWYMPNVLITSHTSGASPHIRERGLEILIENIHRYLRDQPLINVVDKQAGY